MGRTQLSPQRLSETKKLNIGRIIIFCEGKTEKYYFDYFAEILKKNKYTDVEVVLETANGNARTVLNFANAFMADDRNNRKYSTYGKYLAFDCDAPPDIQTVISAASEYELLISNHLFEIWLLMHFEDVNDKISKREIYRRLSSHLHDAYSKGHKGKTREILYKCPQADRAVYGRNIMKQQPGGIKKDCFCRGRGKMREPDAAPFSSCARRPAA